MIRKILVLSYGVSAYLIFLAASVYVIGFVGNIGVPKAMDSPSVGLFLTNLLIDILLLVIFAIQHSVMARPAFKKWWTRIVSTSVERRTYVLISSLCLLLVFWQWHPLGGIVWDVQNP